MTRGKKYALLTSLYLAQGLPFGFFSQAVPVILRDYGVSLSMIGASALLYLPWALKFLWAPWVDRYYSNSLGQRRSWILPMLGLNIVTLLIVAQLDPKENLAWLFYAIFMVNLFAATQDIATDGFAVQTLTPAERGLGNGIQVAGYRAGMIVGGGFILMLLDWLGWQQSFYLMAGFLLLAALPILFHREAPAVKQQPNETKPQQGMQRALLLSYLAQPGIWAWLGIIVLYKFGDGLSSGMVKPMLVDIGLSKTEIGAMVGTAGFVAGLVGALAGGWLTGKLGGYRALMAFLLLQVLGAAAYGLVPLGLQSPIALYSLVVGEHVISGMHTAALFTVMMAACRQQSEGHDYSVQACVVVMASGLGIACSGFVADAFGYSSVHFAGALLALLAVIPISRAIKGRGFKALDASV